MSETIAKRGKELTSQYCKEVYGKSQGIPPVKASLDRAFPKGGKHTRA